MYTVLSYVAVALLLLVAGLAVGAVIGGAKAAERHADTIRRLGGDPAQFDLWA